MLNNADAPRSRQRVLWYCLFGAAYFAGAEAGHFLSFSGSRFATFWPPGGLFLGALLLARRQDWPGFIAASLAANLASDWLFHDKSVAVGLAFWAGNCLQALVGAIILQRAVPKPITLDDHYEMACFLGVAALFAPMLSATMGTSALHWAGSIDSYWTTWQIWWASTAIGVVLVAPILLTSRRDCHTPPDRRRNTARRIEWVVAVVALVVLTDRVFHQSHDAPQIGAQSPMFIIMPLLIWMAIRYEPRDAMLANLAMALTVVWCTTRGFGRIARPDFTIIEQLTFLQAYLTVTAGVTLLLATSIRRRELAEARLQKALNEIRTLRGLISICAKCKKVYNDQGQWQSVESYVSEHTVSWFTVNWNFGQRKLASGEGPPVEEFAASCREGLSLWCQSRRREDRAAA